MQRAAKAGACILPADSEHNALFQALGSGNREELVRVIITASGGPFRTWAVADIEQATLAQALKHPNWSMGQKITIDSASMMNKGLEVIEASYLFALTPDEIDVLVHPQSIIHGMVEFSDCSVVAQLGAPDMRTPIAHCLGGPTALSVRPQSSILPRSANSPSRNPISPGFRGCGWLTTHCGLGVVRRRYIMPRTRSRSRRSSAARSNSARLRGWSRPPSTTGCVPVIWRP